MKSSQVKECVCVTIRRDFSLKGRDFESGCELWHGALFGNTKYDNSEIQGHFPRCSNTY